MFSDVCEVHNRLIKRRNWTRRLKKRKKAKKTVGRKEETVLEYKSHRRGQKMTEVQKKSNPLTMSGDQNMDAEMTEDQKRAAIKVLLLSSNEDEGKEVRKRNADNFAWARRKRDAMLRDPLETESDNSKEEDESGEEGKKKEID
jgi:hypothetical protein